MTTTLLQLLGDSLDYAGLYPPASLPLAEALHKYAEYQQHPQAWMLARFVCPVTRLTELGSLWDEFSPAATLRLAVLGRLDKLGESPLAGLKSDLNAIAALRARLGERVQIETYEAPLPLEYARPADRITAPDDPVGMAAFLSRTSEHFRAAGLTPLSVFLEADSWIALQSALVKSAEAFAGHGSDIRFGWKIRLGGALSFAMPTTSDVARFIAACRDAGCVWKATAGLHQPLGGWGSEHGAFRFGFLSLLVAATLAQTHDLKPATIQQILEEPDRTSFRSDDDTFAWRDITASGPQIVAARERSLISFGSCSFDEPLDGLRELNLLEGAVNHA